MRFFQHEPQGTITSFLGPVPTDWAPPPPCNGIYSDEVAYIDRARFCLPRHYRPWAQDFYSPGTACPTGYTALERCSRSDDGDSRTTVTCCPVRAGITLGCVEDPATLTGPFKDMLCTWSAGDTPKVLLVTTFANRRPNTMSVTMSGFQGVNAFGIRMVQGGSETSSSTSFSSDTASLSMPTITKTGVPEPSMADQMDESQDMPSSHGLTTDAKIVIAAMVPFMLFALGLGVYLVYRRRSRHWKSMETSQPMSEGFKVFEDRANGNRVIMMMLPRRARLSSRAVELPTDFNGTLLPEPPRPNTG